MVLKLEVEDAEVILGFTVVLYWMVLKLYCQRIRRRLSFYSSVILNGTETDALRSVATE